MALLPETSPVRKAMEAGWPHFQLVLFKFRNEILAVTNAPNTIEADVVAPKIYDDTRERSVTFRNDLGYLEGTRQRAPAGQLGRDVFNALAADPKGAWRKRFNAGYINVRIAVWWVFKEPQGDYMVDDLYEWYRGRCLQPRYYTDGNGEESIRLCAAKFGGPLLQLDSIRGRRATKSDQRERDKDDNSHDHVAEVIELRWGDRR